MNPDFQVLGNVLSATRSLEMHDSMSKSGPAKKWFSEMASDWRGSPGPLNWTDQETRHRSALKSVMPGKRQRSGYEPPHDAMFTRSGDIDDMPFFPHAWASMPHHASPAKHDVSMYSSGSIEVQDLPSNPATASQSSDPGAKPFVILARARSLLSSQRIREAHAILQQGTITFPHDKRIARLLRAISPGRTRRSRGATSNRRQELNWIRKNGHKHRGLWVAVSGNHLVASAMTLEQLLADVKKLTGGHETPLVQKIAPA